MDAKSAKATTATPSILRIADMMDPSQMDGMVPEARDETLSKYVGPGIRLTPLDHLPGYSCRSAPREPRDSASRGRAGCFSDIAYAQGRFGHGIPVLTA
jgi:hypothetical protein